MKVHLNQRHAGKNKIGTFYLKIIPILAAFLLTACAPNLPDYNLYENMRQYAEQKFQECGALMRDDLPDIFKSEYILNLFGLIRLVFRSPQLEVHLSSYESSDMAVGSYSMFEVPPNSSTFTDFALSIRPSAHMRAPLIHTDAVKAMGGMPGSFEIYLLNVNKDSINIEEFLGDQVGKMDEALELVASYQRQGEDRGKYTEHIDEYIYDDYRIEVDESYIQERTEEAREAYYDAILQAYKLYMDAYFTSLERLEPEDDQELINGTKEGTETYMDIIYEKDFAAQMGKTLFKDDFDAYFLEGFWRAGYYGEGIE